MSDKETVYIMPKKPIRARIVYDSKGKPVQYVNLEPVGAVEVNDSFFFSHSLWEEIEVPKRFSVTDYSSMNPDGTTIVE